MADIADNRRACSYPRHCVILPVLRKDYYRVTDIKEKKYVLERCAERKQTLSDEEISEY